jgi:hypothetical protein
VLHRDGAYVGKKVGKVIEHDPVNHDQDLAEIRTLNADVVGASQSPSRVELHAGNMAQHVGHRVGVHKLDVPFCYYGNVFGGL